MEWVSKLQRAAAWVWPAAATSAWLLAAELPSACASKKRSAAHLNHRRARQQYPIATRQKRAGYTALTESSATDPTCAQHTLACTPCQAYERFTRRQTHMAYHTDHLIHERCDPAIDGDHHRHTRHSFFRSNHLARL